MVVSSIYSNAVQSAARAAPSATDMASQSREAVRNDGDWTMHKACCRPMWPSRSPVPWVNLLAQM